MILKVHLICLIYNKNPKIKKKNFRNCKLLKKTKDKDILFDVLNL